MDHIKLTTKQSGGRPAKFKTPEALQKQIDRYFESCWAQKVDTSGNPIFLRDKNGKQTKKKILLQIKPYTITGLAVFLNTTRETLTDYEAKKKFSDTIKRTKEKIHAYAEEALFIGKNPAGVIFNLKNNWGWKDKTETDINAKIQPLIVNRISYKDFLHTKSN